MEFAYRKNAASAVKRGESQMPFAPHIEIRRHRAFRLLVGGVAMLGIFIALEFLWMAKCDLSIIPVGFFGGINILEWAGGVLLLLLFGLIHWLLGDPPLPPPPIVVFPTAQAGTNYHDSRPTEDEEPQLDYWPEPETQTSAAEEEPDEAIAPPAADAQPIDDDLPADIRAEIEKLVEFRKRDMITEDEFNRRRERLLAQVR